MHALKLIAALLSVGAAGLAGVVATHADESKSVSDVLVVALDAEPRSLDPHTTTAASDFRVAVNVYEGLTRFKAGTLEPGPALARRWEVSDEGTQYTFYLRPDVRFHDGTPFDADAVKFNFDRMLDKAHPYHDTGPFPLAFFFERVQSVIVVDPLTVRLELDEAFAPLLANLAYPTGLMVSPQAVRSWGKEVARHPAGTGPFLFATWDAGHRIVLSRNDDYWAARASTAKLIFRPIADPMTRVAELAAGSVDLAVELSPDNVAYFRGAPGFDVEEVAGPHLWFLLLNTNEPPFDDVRVRRAVNLAVDKQALVTQVLQDTAEVAAGPIAKAFGPSSGAIEPYPHDPDRARQLLSDAGVQVGTKLRFLVPQGGSGMLAPVAMATAIQADLAAVGLDVTIESLEWSSYLTKVNAGLTDAHMAEMAWMTNDPDTLPFLALRSEARPPKGFNSGWYENDEVDRLLLAARRSTDVSERAALYARVQQLVHDDAPWLFVASWRQNVVLSDRVLGLQLEPSFLLTLDRVRKR